jgi:hypothetical protein
MLPEANVIKMSAIYECLLLSIVFDPDKLFQPSLNKHSSSEQIFVNYRQKSCIKLGPDLAPLSREY